MDPYYTFMEVQIEVNATSFSKKEEIYITSTKRYIFLFVDMDGSSTCIKSIKFSLNAKTTVSFLFNILTVLSLCTVISIYFLNFRAS